MTGFLVDVDTGNPVLDVETGLLIPVDDETAVKQIIYMLLNCQPGSEIMHPYYGFDLESALRLSDMEESEMFIETLLADALDPKKEKLISNVNYIKATRDGNDPRKMNVIIAAIASVVLPVVRSASGALPVTRVMLDVNDDVTSTIASKITRILLYITTFCPGNDFANSRIAKASNSNAVTETGKNSATIAVAALDPGIIRARMVKITEKNMIRA